MSLAELSETTVLASNPTPMVGPERPRLTASILQEIGNWLIFQLQFYFRPSDGRAAVS
jgi:hypothetical protein